MVDYDGGFIVSVVSDVALGQHIGSNHSYHEKINWRTVVRCVPLHRLGHIDFTAHNPLFPWFRAAAGSYGVRAAAAYQTGCGNGLSRAGYDRGNARRASISQRERKDFKRFVSTK